MEKIYQLQKLNSEDWIDVPENLYNNGQIPFKARRIIILAKDLLDKQQADIANYYNKDKKDYYQGRIDFVKEVFDK